jgi:ATP-dependent Lhr-like helicase
VEADPIWSDDGIIVHLPDADEPPGADLVLMDADAAEDLVVAELGGSALFGARFRENAARALLIPRAHPGRRMPLWQQRLKSQSLLEVARRYPQFPIILETYRECLRDVLDVPGLTDLLRKVQTREVSVVEVETATASPFASSLLFDYIATYMYEGDAPNAERRAAALALDRDLLRELLGQEELRELISAEALAQVEADLQRRSERTLAGSSDAMHDALRRLGDLTGEEVRERATVPEEAEEWLADLERQRRALRLVIGGEPRWVSAEDAGLFRDALGVAPPAGLPPEFVEDVPDALERLVRRFAATHGPFEAGELKARYGIDLTPILAGLERAGELMRGELRPAGTSREWCDPEVLRRLRRASLAALRKEVEPADQRAFARFVPAWQGVDRHQPGGAGVDRLREVLVPLQGVALAPEVWERDVLPRRMGAYTPAWMDELCVAGEVVWIGAGSLGKRTGRVALFFRDDVALLGRPGGVHPVIAGRAHQAVRERLGRGPCFYADILLDCMEFPSEKLQDALWDLVWAGEVTNDVFAPLRSPRLSAPIAAQRAASQRGRRGNRFGVRRPGAMPQVQGRWSLTGALFGAAPADPRETRRAQAELLLERHGVVTRELVSAEGGAGGFSALYDAFSALEMVGLARRGYFVEGLGGAQFSLPAAVERLRGQREASSADEPVLLAATDPAQPYGAGLRWPNVEGRSPARQAGAYVVLAGGEPIVYVERGGSGLQILAAPADPRIGAALRVLVEAVQRGQIRRLALEKVDGEPAVASSYAKQLLALGFRAGPRKLTLTG